MTQHPGQLNFTCLKKLPATSLQRGSDIPYRKAVSVQLTLRNQQDSLKIVHKPVVVIGSCSGLRFGSDFEPHLHTERLPRLRCRMSAQCTQRTAKAFAESTAAPRPKIVADDGSAQPVEIGHHDAALDPPRDLVDEPGQAGVVAEPEDRHLRTEAWPCRRSPSRCGRSSADAAGSRRTPTCRRRRRSSRGARSARRR